MKQDGSNPTTEWPTPCRMLNSLWAQMIYLGQYSSVRRTRNIQTAYKQSPTSSFDAKPKVQVLISNKIPHQSSNLIVGHPWCLGLIAIRAGRCFCTSIVVAAGRIEKFCRTSYNTKKLLVVPLGKMKSTQDAFV
jgi:hypothetical protein